MNANVVGVRADSAKGSLEHARNMRAYRQLVARLLFELSAGVDPATASSISNDLTADSLDSVPHWCLLDNTSLGELIRIAGALFTAPTLRQCIEGKQLVKWRHLLGDALFDEVLEAVEHLPHSKPLPVPEASETLLCANGASILLSTLDGHPARLLLQDRIENHNGLVNRQLSFEIYTMASGIHHRLQNHTSSMTGQGRSVDVANTTAAGIAS